jgi:multidrug efflux system membrane fusion protein
MRATFRRPIRFLLACAVFIAVGVLVSHFLTKSPSAHAPSPPPAVPVVVAKAKKGDQPIYLTGLGTVTPLNTVTLRSRVDGELLRIAVTEGQLITAGELVAEIDPRPFEVQLTQAEGQKERDEAQLANARVDLERYTILYQQNSVPKQQLDTQVAIVRQFEAAVKTDQGVIDNAKLQLIYTKITSPINGRIGLRQIDPGNIIHTTDTNGIAIVTQLQPISVIFSLPQDNIPDVMKKLRKGNQLRVDAYDRDMKNKITGGCLLTLDNQVDVTTGTVRFRAIFDNTDNALFPNQFVNARLLLDTKRRTILIPTAALQRGPQATFVYVVKPDSTVETRNVVVGPIERDVAAIDSGLAAGEIVVTQGTDKLEAGARVQARSAAGEENSL